MVKNGGFSEDDAVLIAKVKKGDTQAFEELMLKYEDGVYNVVAGIVGSYHDASDVVQEAFFKAYVNIRKLKGEKKFAAWVYTIAVNCAKNRYKQQKREEKRDGGSEDSNAGSVRDDSMQVEGVAENNETTEFVAQSIGKLSPEHRAVLILRHMQGMGYDEIAKVMKCSLGTVKSRIARARESLAVVIRDKIN